MTKRSIAIQSRRLVAYRSVLFSLPCLHVPDPLPTIVSSSLTETTPTTQQQTTHPSARYIVNAKIQCQTDQCAQPAPCPSSPPSYYGQRNPHDAQKLKTSSSTRGPGAHTLNASGETTSWSNPFEAKQSWLSHIPLARLERRSNQHSPSLVSIKATKQLTISPCGVILSRL